MSVRNRFSAVTMLGALLMAACGERTDVAVGALAPDFKATDLGSGKAVSLREDYRGEVTLVNVWATYCGPCREEIPALQKLYQALGPRGLRIAAVSVDTDSASKVSGFMREFGVTFDVLHDPDGSIQEAYRSQRIPESFLVNRSGHIVYIYYSAKDWASEGTQRLVASLLDEPAR